MSQTPTVPPFVNRAMKFVLRSPVHGMVSKTVLLITFTGRKSGKILHDPGQLLSIRRSGVHFYPCSLVEKPAQRRAGHIALTGPGAPGTGRTGRRG